MPSAPDPRQPNRTRQPAWQIQEAHSISAGLDYPGIGPEHSWLHDINAWPTSRRPTGGSACSSSAPAWRASCRRSSRPMPWPRCAGWRPGCRRITFWS